MIGSVRGDTASDLPMYVSYAIDEAALTSGRLYYWRNCTDAGVF